MLEHGFQTTGWTALFKSSNIDSMPISAEAKTTVTSVRDSVTAWDCGGRRKRPTAAVAKVRQKRQELAKQKTAAVVPAAAKAAAVAKPSTPAVPTPAAAPAAAKVAPIEAPATAPAAAKAN